MDKTKNNDKFTDKLKFQLINNPDFEKKVVQPGLVENELFEIEKQIIEQKIPIDLGVATDEHIKQRENVSFVEFRRGSSSRKPGYVLAAWSFFSALCDTLINFGIACLFMVASSLVMQRQSEEVFEFFQDSFPIIFILLFMAFQSLYMLLTRAFIGASLGEWASGIRLGSVKDRLDSFYIARVFGRSLMVFCTGIFVLPILSLLIGKDAAGFLSGIYLVKIDHKNHV
jgi:hypothetical protein